MYVKISVYKISNRIRINKLVFQFLVRFSFVDQLLRSRGLINYKIRSGPVLYENTKNVGISCPVHSRSNLNFSLSLSLKFLLTYIDRYSIDGSINRPYFNFILAVFSLVFIQFTAVYYCYLNYSFNFNVHQDSLFQFCFFIIIIKPYIFLLGT